MGHAQKEFSFLLPKLPDYEYLEQKSWTEVEKSSIEPSSASYKDCRCTSRCARGMREGRKNQCQYSLFRHFKKKFPKFFQQLYYLWKLLGLWAASVVLRRLWCCAQRGLSGSRGFPGRRLFGGRNLRTLRFVGSDTWGIRKVQATPLWDEMGLQWHLLLKGLYLGFLTKQTKMQLWRFAARAAFLLQNFKASS